MYFKYSFKYPAINMQDNISIKYLQNKIVMQKANMLNIITDIVPYNCGDFINCNAMSSGIQQFWQDQSHRTVTIPAEDVNTVSWHPALLE